MTAQLLAERPTIRILLYTDDPNAISQGNNLLGLSSMIDRLKAHAPAFADLSIKWVSRSSDSDHHADNKLNDVMQQEIEESGEPFDEIWFFGLHQANTERFSLGAFRGGPESELTDEEIEALREWMKANGEDGAVGGGVLMTGDHNNPVPPNLLPSNNGDDIAAAELLGLGRAIGRFVPRAGELRKWDGPPSFRASQSHNTLASTGFQTDRVPQDLILERVNADGAPDPLGRPHPLFMYQPGSFIDVFPDHRHEGELVIPNIEDREDVWPSGPGGQPKPVVVAFGTDRRNGDVVNLVTAYDGDAAEVGRIVADSSWHHYVNINLNGFPHPAPANSTADKIGQYYGNLAVWLAPKHKRRQMAQVMYQELADYTLLLEEPGDLLRTGEVANELLERAASSCEINELLQVFENGEIATSDAPETRMSVNRLRVRQQRLGAVIDTYQQAMIEAEQATDALRSLDSEEIVNRGLARAAAGSDSSTSITSPANNGARRTLAAREEEEEEWTIDVVRDISPQDPPLAARLIFNLTAKDGVLAGNVSEALEGTLLSQVTGQRQPLLDTDEAFMTLDFKWGEADVMLAGVTFKTTINNFRGRFRALVLNGASSNGRANTADDDPPPRVTPGNGDTGTGSGQQT